MSLTPRARSHPVFRAGALAGFQERPGGLRRNPASCSGVFLETAASARGSAAAASRPAFVSRKGQTPLSGQSQDARLRLVRVRIAGALGKTVDLTAVKVVPPLPLW